MPKNPQNNKPVHRIRSGALSVSIWERSAKDSVFYSANIQRAYTQDDGKTWEHTDSLNRDDLPVAALLMQSAWAWINRKEQEKVKEYDPDQGRRASDSQKP